MRVSITRGGQCLSDEETSYLALALREDTQKYRDTHDRVKSQEVARLQLRLPEES